MKFPNGLKGPFFLLDDGGGVSVIRELLDKIAQVRFNEYVVRF